MWWLLTGVVLLVLITAMISSPGKKTNVSTSETYGILFLAAIGFILGVLIVAIGPHLGYGTVDGEPYTYADYLKRDTIYRVHHITNVGNEHIILVQMEGKDAFKVIRVTGPLPPPVFVLVKGKPVAVLAAAR